LEGKKHMPEIAQSMLLADKALLESGKNWAEFL
jgi:hypothetical protein